MPAEAVWVQIPQRAVVGREGFLVDPDEENQDIAHSHEGWYSTF